MRKVLLAGYNGFLARYLVAQLIENREIDLTVLSNHEGSVDRNYSVINYSRFIEQNKDRFDVAIVVASSIDDNIKNLSLTSFNCSQFHLLLLNLKNTGVDRVILISSASLILKDLVQSSLYLQSKQIQETIIKNLSFQSYLILRLSSPIGVGMQENRIFYQMLKTVDNKNVFEFYGDLNRRQNYIDIRDAVENIISSMNTSELSGTFYLSSPSSISNVDLYVKLSKSLNSNVQYEHNRIYNEEGLDISYPAQRILFPNKHYWSYGDTAKWMLNEDIRF